MASATIVIDASGSTRETAKMADGSKVSVFKKQHIIAKEFMTTQNLTNVRVVYFCSRQNNGRFANGIYIVPLPVPNPDDLISLADDVFSSVADTCLTNSWLPFTWTRQQIILFHRWSNGWIRRTQC